MIDLLIVVVRWLAGLRSDGNRAVRSDRFLPPLWAVCGLRGVGSHAADVLRDIGWMMVRLDSLSCVRVLSGSSSARRGPVTGCTTPRYGGA
jgi:hypothetical protein